MQRRRFMGALAAAPFLGWLGSAMAEAALGATGNSTHGQIPTPSQIPGGMPRRPVPGQWPDDGPQFPAPQIDKKAAMHEMLLQNEKNIRKDVARLYDLADSLRKQVSSTDSSEVLSVKMVKTADEIEKLAKHIKKLASG